MEKFEAIEDSTVTVRIDCRKCTVKCRTCHLKCPQVAAVQSDSGKEVTRDLLQKGRRARKYKDIDVSFSRFIEEVAKKEEEHYVD